MYAELDLKFKQALDMRSARARIAANAGANQITPAAALQGTVLANEPTILAAALAAERIMNVATIIYFVEGGDTIKAHIVVRSLSDLRKQCARITRQLKGVFPAQPLVEATARVLVQVRGTDEAVISGRRVSFFQRMAETLLEKFVAKFVPAAVTFALAATFLAGTPAVQSAWIGALAACAGALVEATIAARNADEWKWKDLP